MTDDFGRMPFSPEMNAFQAEIGSNQRLVTGGNLQDGAVIPDAGGNSWPSTARPRMREISGFSARGKMGLIIYKGGVNRRNLGQEIQAIEEDEGNPRPG